MTQKNKATLWLMLIALLPIGQGVVKEIINRPTDWYSISAFSVVIVLIVLLVRKVL